MANQLHVEIMILLLLLLLSAVANCSLVNIKIVESPHQNRHFSSNTQNIKKLTLRGPPAPISGPPHLRALAEDCFDMRHRNYLYRICPFHNVTQKEESNMWNRFYGVLGVWREWVIEEDKFVGMLYSFGEKCGRTNREAKLMFRCSTITKLTNVTEPKTCKYTIWMWTPLACFKGAMQVYRVLTTEQLAIWEELNSEYHNQIITRQGLLRKRRQLLLSAGLYYNFTKDEEYDRHDSGYHANSHHDYKSQVHSDSCQTRLAKVEKDLKTAQLQLSLYDRALSLNPSVQQQLNQLLIIANQSNSTNSSSPTGHHSNTTGRHSNTTGRHSNTTGHRNNTTGRHSNTTGRRSNTTSPLVHSVVGAGRTNHKPVTQLKSNQAAPPPAGVQATDDTVASEQTHEMDGRSVNAKVKATGITVENADNQAADNIHSKRRGL